MTEDSIKCYVCKNTDFITIDYLDDWNVHVNECTKCKTHYLSKKEGNISNRTMIVRKFKKDEIKPGDLLVFAPYSKQWKVRPLRTMKNKKDKKK